MGSFASVLAYLGLVRGQQYQKARDGKSHQEFRLRCNFMTQDGFLLTEGEVATLHRRP